MLIEGTSRYYLKKIRAKQYQRAFGGKADCKN